MSNGNGQRRPSVSDAVKRRLNSELRLLQIKAGIGYEVTVEWKPDATDCRVDGRKLAEVVRGNTIFIFSSNLEDAIWLVRHGFLEWILNQHTRPYLRLINKLITLHEEQQYENKEKVIEAVLKLL